MRIWTFAAAVALFSPLALGSLHIHRVVSSKRVELRGWVEKIVPKVGEKYPVFNKDSQPVGYVQIEKIFSNKPDRFVGLARPVMHSQNELMVKGDEVRVLDFSQAQPDIDGRQDILLRNNKEYSSRYKPLVYQGITIGETAETLAQGEHLAGIFTYYSYGVTDELSVSSWVALNFVETPNIKVKYRAIQEEWVTLSPSLQLLHYPKTNMTAVTTTIHLMIGSNSKFSTHTALSLTSLVGDARGTPFEGTALLSSSLQTGYVYILDNWDRLLLGPKFNFASQSVGGYLGYMFVWDHIHLSFILESSDFLNFRIGSPGYIPSVDLFVRF